MLHAQNFLNDEEVKRSIDSLLERLMFYQRNIKRVNKPLEEFKQSFNALSDKVSRFRSPLYYPYLSSGLGNGSFVECSDGSVKLDFISGIGCHFSHSDINIVKHSLYASLLDTVMQGNLQQHDGSVELFELLSKHSGMDNVYLTTSGAMAVENALKICFQYKETASRVLAFSHCFCGRTLAAASITDKPGNRVGLPIVLPVDYIPFYDPKCPKESTENAVSHLRKYISRYPDKHACMKMELIQGEGGFNVGSRSFFLNIIEVLKEHDIPVFVDEIQTFGRTTALFAFQMFKLDNEVDIVTIGKLSQVSATLYQSKLNPKPGLISQTFTSSSTAVEVSKYIIKSLVSDNYFGKKGKNARIHGYFSRKLRQLSKKYPQLLSTINGVGTMISFIPYNGDRQKVIDFSHRCFQEGLISFIAGNNPTKIRFLLPVGSVTFSDVDCALSILERCLIQSR